MPNQLLNCPLCGNNKAQCPFDSDGREVHRVTCATCGTYEITMEAEDAVARDPAANGSRWHLSAATRRAADDDREILIRLDNWKDFADSFAGTSIKTKERLLLEAIRSGSAFFGDMVAFSFDVDWPQIAANGPAECWAILEHVRDAGLLAQGRTLDQWALTWGGWETIEPIAGGVPGICFVAMAFSPDLIAAFEDGFRNAIETDCGLKAVRIDKEHFGDKICDRILVEIKRAQFVVADFTLNRGGVYFEAGYALALGRPVIWSCREDKVDELHFDTRQYPHILWNGAADLREKLRDRIRALIPGARTS